LHTGGNGVVFSVGAVYDRAFGPLACESCAVIDRAYSKNKPIRPVALVCYTH